MNLRLSKLSLQLWAVVLVAASGIGQRPSKVAGRPQVRVVDRASEWNFPGGATLKIERRLFHGADYQTTAHLRWPHTKQSGPRRFSASIAADAFANVQPWLVAWQRKEPVLYVFVGDRGRRRSRPAFRNVRRIDLRDPSAIKVEYARGLGPAGFIPKAIVQALDERVDLPPVMALEVTVQKRQAKAENLLEVLCRLDLGKAAADRPVRFSAVIPEEKDVVRPAGRSRNPMLARSDAAEPLVRPTNSGLPIIQARADAGGAVLALVQLSERAWDRGGVIYPSLAKASKVSRGVPRPGRMLATLAAIEKYKRRSDGPGTLSGSLVDAAGQPVVGAMIGVGVVVAGASFPRLRKTDGSGGFRLKGLPVGQPLQLVVRRGSRCVGLSNIPALTKGEGRTLRLELRDAARQLQLRALEAPRKGR